MEPSDQNINSPTKEDKENMSESRGNEMEKEGNAVKRKKVPVSSLSDEEDGLEVLSKRVKSSMNDESSEEPFNTKNAMNKDPSESKVEQHSLPTIKIQPILGVKPLSFPVHPRLTLIDLKDFILFSLNIPHPQQILSFYDENDRKVVLLSNYSENTLLCTVPGLIDEITGRCAPVSLTFKMSSGMDFNISPSDVEYENSGNTSDTEGYFELNGTSVGADADGGISDDTTSSKISSLASTLASIIPFPPGVSKSSKMLIRSLSKSSPTNSNLPTLWEIYFPESGVKMMVTALINVNEVKSDDEKEGGIVETGKGEDVNVDADVIKANDHIEPNKPSTPVLVITDESKESEPYMPPVILGSEPLKTDESSPKTNCEKCRVRCRPALRFICKCHKTFCQSHRYPDKHDCTFDHRADGIATIQANNPKIVKDKVGNF